MKKLSISSIVGGAYLLAFVPTLSALVELTANSGIFLNLTAQYQYDSNIYLSPKDTHDHILLVAPALEYKNQDSFYQVTATLGAELLRFNSNSDEDSNDFKSNLNLSFPNGTESHYKAALQAGYNQNSFADEFTGGRVQSRDLHLGGSLDYKITDRYGFTIAPTYDHRKARNAGRVSEETWSLGLGANYFYSERLSFDLSGRYRNVSMEGTPNVSANDYAISVGATGDLLTKLTGTISIGAQKRDYDDKTLKDDTSPYASASLKWDFQEMTSAQINVTKDFSVSSNNSSNDRFRVAAALDHNFNSKISANLGASWEESTLLAVNNSRRNDEQWSVFGGLAYIFTERANASFRLYYSERTSDTAGLIYEQVTATTSLNIRF